MSSVQGLLSSVDALTCFRETTREPQKGVYLPFLSTVNTRLRKNEYFQTVRETLSYLLGFSWYKGQETILIGPSNLDRKANSLRYGRIYVLKPLPLYVLALCLGH